MLYFAVGGGLELNFDKGLQRVLQEARFWQCLQDQTIRLPFSILEIMRHQDRLFLLRPHVSKIVKAYNAIFEGLSASSTQTEPEPAK